MSFERKSAGHGIPMFSLMVAALCLGSDVGVFWVSNCDVIRRWHTLQSLCTGAGENKWLGCLIALISCFVPDGVEFHECSFLYFVMT